MAAPTAGELQLAGGLFGDVVNDVDSIVDLVGDDAVAGGGIRNRFLVELAQGGDFTYAALEVGLAEEIAGAGEYLAADYLFTGKVVAVDDDVVERCLLAFRDAHLHVHGVVLDIGLHRIHLEEEVAVVAVELGHVVLVLLAAAEEALFHGHHVVDVALLDSQDLVQGFGGVYRVARPGDVAEVILVAFLNRYVDGEAARFEVIHRIFHDAGVAVAGLVEGAQKSFFIVGVFLGVELFAVEEVVPFVALGLLHAPGELVFLHVFVAVEVDFADLDLVAAVHGEVHAYGVADNGIFLNLGLDLAVQETLFRIEAFDDVGRCFFHVGGELAAAAQAQAVLQVFLFTGLHSGEGPAGNPGTLHDANFQEDAVACRAQVVDIQGHVVEEALQGEPLHDGGHLFAGDCNLHALLQAGQVDNLAGGEVMVAFHVNAAQDIFLRAVIVYFHSPFLSQKTQREQHCCKKRQEFLHSHLFTFPKRRSREEYSSSAARKLSFLKSGQSVSVKTNSL